MAAIAEAGGFDVVTVFSDLMYQPPLPALLEIAGATTRVRVGPSSLNPYSVAPHEIAGQVATLDLASAGRSFLGLARGAWLDVVGIHQTSSVARIAECWEVVRRLLAGETDGYRGEFFSLEAGVGLRYPTARREVPLLVGTWGPRTARLAGTIASEVKVGGSANPAIVPWIRRHIDNDAVDVVVGAVTVVDESGAAARRRARQEVAMYLTVVAELDPTIEMDPEVLERVRAALSHGDPEGAGAAIPDDVLYAFCFAGTPGEVADHAAALFDAGADRVEFGTPHGLDDVAGVTLLCDRVAPALK